MNFEFEYHSKKYNIRYNLIPIYLHYTGWSKVKEKNGRMLYQYNKRNQITLMVPNPDSGDFQLRIRDMIRVLEAVEKRHYEEIIESVNNVKKDIWKISIAKGSNIDSLSIDVLEKVIKSIKGLIEYSASAEQIAKPYFEQSLSTGKTYSKKCRIGQTFRGSYGITMEIPIEEPAVSSENVSDKTDYTPIGRKITERIFKSLRLVEQENEIVDITPIYEESINGNICLALKTLLELSEGDIENVVCLSPIWEAPDEMKNNPIVCIKHSNISYLDEVYEKMFQQNELINNCTILGTIIELKHIFDEEDDSDYNIIISGTHNDGNKFDFHVALNKEDYLKACRIHAESVAVKKEKIIELSGKLRRTKKKWYVDSYFNFEEIQNMRANRAQKNKTQVQLSDF
jgi:hypothetical protein